MGKFAAIFAQRVPCCDPSAPFISDHAVPCPRPDGRGRALCIRCGRCAPWAMTLQRHPRVPAGRWPAGGASALRTALTLRAAPGWARAPWRGRASGVPARPALSGGDPTSRARSLAGRRQRAKRNVCFRRMQREISHGSSRLSVSPQDCEPEAGELPTAPPAPDLGMPSLVRAAHVGVATMSACDAMEPAQPGKCRNIESAGQTSIWIRGGRRKKDAEGISGTTHPHEDVRTNMARRYPNQVPRLSLERHPESAQTRPTLAERCQTLEQFGRTRGERWPALAQRGRIW